MKGIDPKNHVDKNKDSVKEDLKQKARGLRSKKRHEKDQNKSRCDSTEVENNVIAEQIENVAIAIIAYRKRSNSSC